MTKNELFEMVQSMGFPAAYHHFAEGEAPDPPFVVYLFPESNNFFADNKVHKTVSVLHVELYADKKDFAVENIVEGALNAAGLAWQKTESWIESQRLYEVLYEMEVVIDD